MWSQTSAQNAILPGEASVPDDPAKRYLLDYCLEPWGTKLTKINRTIRPSIPSYAHVLQWFDKLFDPEQLRITPEDFALARLVTPTLTDEFAVGKIWPLAWHQLRRTGAVNMQASGLVSDASLQFQLKHVARAMSLYYGQTIPGYGWKRRPIPTTSAPCTKLWVGSCNS
ncbi:hypothetical protein OMD46_12070 [Pseudomonas sp. MDMC_285]|nr:hypothetical protein [Pseudomonas sp. MDMC_285]